MLHHVFQTISERLLDETLSGIVAPRTCDLFRGDLSIDSASHNNRLPAVFIEFEQIDWQTRNPYQVGECRLLLRLLTHKPFSESRAGASTQESALQPLELLDAIQQRLQFWGRNLPGIGDISPLSRIETRLDTDNWMAPLHEVRYETVLIDYQMDRDQSVDAVVKLNKPTFD